MSITASNELLFLPEDDGNTHINIYSKAKTELGRMLSHFHYAPFNHPEYGTFLTMEGFWHYLATGCKYEPFKNMPGIKAKTFAKGMTKVFRDDFMNQIKFANELKILKHPSILHCFCKSTLPFEHYYSYGYPPVVRRPNDAQKLIDLFESIRVEFKEKKLWLTDSHHQHSLLDHPIN